MDHHLKRQIDNSLAEVAATICNVGRLFDGSGGELESRVNGEEASPNLRVRMAKEIDTGNDSLKQVRQSTCSLNIIRETADL